MPQENFIRSPEDFLWNFYQQMKESPEGPQEFLSAKGGEKDREYWAICMVLLAVNEITGNSWLLKNATEDPPDGEAVIYRYEQGGKQIIEEVVLMEVVTINKFMRRQRWDEQLSNEDNVFNFLNQKKLSSKRYRKETHLVINFTVHFPFFDLEELSRRITDTHPHFTEIWYILSYDDKYERYQVGSLYPEEIQYEMNIKDYLKNSRRY